MNPPKTTELAGEMNNSHIDKEWGQSTDNKNDKNTRIAFVNINGLTTDSCSPSSCSCKLCNIINKIIGGRSGTNSKDVRFTEFVQRAINSSFCYRLFEFVLGHDLFFKRLIVNSEKISY